MRVAFSDFSLIVPGSKKVAYVNHERVGMFSRLKIEALMRKLTRGFRWKTDVEGDGERSRKRGQASQHLKPS
jgi:hypothetical protein